MKKSLLLTGALILATTSLSAMDTQMIVGLDITSAKIKNNIGYNGTATVNGVNYSNLSSGVEERDTGFDLKVGVILNKSHRLTANYSKYSFKQSIDMNTITANYDYLFVTSSKFTPFIGAHVGVLKADFSGFNDTGSIYGIQGGSTYSLTENIEFEIGLSYSKLNSTAATPTVSGTLGSVILTNASAYVKTDNMVKTYVGLNYKF